MVFNDYFLIVPVYRVDEEKYYDDMNRDFENSISKTWDDNFRSNYPSLVEGQKVCHRSCFGGGWEFNEIIGYIKLHFLGAQVRGEYWETVPKRKVRTRRKQFEYKTHKLAAEV